MDFQALRKEYQDKGMAPEDLSACPVAQLKDWLADASENSPGEWFEVNAMALATASSDGSVSVRYVLLKGIEAECIRFFTNYESKKGRQLESNPNCSVVFHWPFLGRQIRISGRVEKTSREVSQSYFHSRPRGAQIGAAVSNQSQEIASRDELADRMNQMEEVLDGAEVPLPEGWGGYQILPVEFEFWQGRTNRLHDRVVYRSESNSWTKHRLAP